MHKYGKIIVGFELKREERKLSWPDYPFIIDEVMNNKQSVVQYQDINMDIFTEMRSAKESVVVDVREGWEFDEFNIGGVNIPMGEVHSRVGELTDFQTIFVICANGSRSKVAAHFYGRTPILANSTVFHLKGGILEAEY